ncbi:MAG: c-type cytochrome [Planctomycetes bacterium]|nr:c-type cytochrome [Planctomycetota bacterium]
MDRTRMPVAAFRVVTLAALAAGAIVTPVATAGDPVGASPGAKATARESARVELGRRLFFEPRASRAGLRSCADCHDPEHGFSDRRRFSLDDRGPTKRRSQSLVDGALNPSAHWDGAFRRVADLVTARTNLSMRGTVSLGHEPPGGAGVRALAGEPRRDDKTGGLADAPGYDDPAAKDGATVAPPEPTEANPEGDESPQSMGECPPYTRETEDGYRQTPPDEGGGGSAGGPYHAPAAETPPGTREPGDPAPTPSAPATTPSSPAPATGPTSSAPSVPAPSPGGAAGAAGKAPDAPAGADPAKAKPVAPRDEDPFAGPTDAEAMPRFLDASIETASLPLADQALEAAGRYREGFLAAFGSPDPTVAKIAEAIAAYCESLRSGTSAYDRFVAGEKSALSESARRGIEVFQGKAGCVSCHTMGAGRATFSDYEFHNTGVVWASIYAKDDAARLDVADRRSDLGAGELTGRPKHRRAFKTPSLRDAVRRAPYMHDGSLRNLDAVVRFYEAGTTDPAADPKLTRFTLTSGERADLLAFLRSLTSEDRPGLAATAWRERSEDTRLKLVDAAGRPLADTTVKLVPAGDRLPGADAADRDGWFERSDASGVIRYRPPAWTHVRLVLPDGVAAVDGALVPDTCREATVRVAVHGQVRLVLTMPPKVPAPATVVADHVDAKVFPDLRMPRTVFRRMTVLNVGDKEVALYVAAMRTDVPPRVALRLPVRVWGLDRLRVTLDPKDEVRLDLSK